jgi:hypothetical protein
LRVETTLAQADEQYFAFDLRAVGIGDLQVGLTHNLPGLDVVSIPSTSSLSAQPDWRYRSACQAADLHGCKRRVTSSGDGGLGSRALLVAEFSWRLSGGPW